MPEAAIGGHPARDRQALAYNPSLDGLRGLAVALVFLFHARTPGFEAGYVGVDIFFVLSGYLITTILLAEIDSSGTVKWWPFVVRRLWRLAPALVVLCAVLLVLSNWVWRSSVAPWLEVLLTLTYVSDVTVSVLDAPEMLVHSWSLSIEEHFYLIWPLVLLALARTRRHGLPVVLLALYAAAMLWRIEALTLGTEWREVYHRLDTRLSGLIFGAALAALCRVVPGTTLRSVPWWLVAVPLAAWFVAEGDWNDHQMLTFGVAAVEVATAAVVLAVAAGSGALAAVLSVAPLRWLGQLSYSFYLWHYPVLRILRDHEDWEVALLIGLPVSLGLAALSFATVERWGLRMRARQGV